MSQNVMKNIRQQDMSRFQIAAVTVCVMINMLDGFDVLAIAFTASSIAKEWGLSQIEVGILFSAGLAGMTIGSLVIAPLADRIGRRLVILGCLVVITLGMLLSAGAGGQMEMVGLRAFTGLGIGGLLASINTVVAEYSSDKRRDFTISLLATGYPIGAVVGGVIAVWLMHEYGWRSVYIFGGTISFIMLPLTLIWVPESIDFLLERRPRNTLERINRVLQRLKAAPVHHLPPVVAAEDKKSGVLDVFRGSNLAGTLQICTAYFMVMFTFYFLLNWTPKILVDLGFSAEMGVSGAVFMNLGGILGGLALGVLSSRFLTRNLSGLFMVFCFIAVAVFGYLPTDLYLMMPVAFVIGFLMFGAMISLYAIVPLLYPARLRNTGTGLAIGIGRLGATAGPAVAGFLIDDGWARADYFMLLGVPMLLAMLAVRSIKVIRERQSLT